MTKRVLPPPDKFASCPRDGNILNYYDGQFGAVYVLLHPFAKPLSISIDRFCPDKWPTKQELIEGAEAVSWNTALQLTGLSSISEIDIGLRTTLLGLKKEFARDDLSDVLRKFGEDRSIICPTEGELAR